MKLSIYFFVIYSYYLKKIYYLLLGFWCFLFKILADKSLSEYISASNTGGYSILGSTVVILLWTVSSIHASEFFLGGISTKEGVNGKGISAPSLTKPWWSVDLSFAIY